MNTIATKIRIYFFFGSGLFFGTTPLYVISKAALSPFFFKAAISAVV
jgi:hypothetical protein